MYDFLKKIPLFEGLPDEDFERLCQMVTEVHLPQGAQLFAEGALGDKAYVIVEGQIEILKFSGGRAVQLAVRQPGEVIGEMSLLEAAPRFASGRARTDSVLLEISHAQLNELLNTSPSAARAMLFTFISRLRSSEILLRQSEKMAQLGTLTAGIAHELNNPAAAAKRGSSQLTTALSNLQQSQRDLIRVNLSDDQWAVLIGLEGQAREKAGKAIDLDSMARSDREYELETWMEDHGIEDGWELAPVLVNLEYEVKQLEELAQTFNPVQFPAVVEWLGATYTVYSLLAEIGQGAERISDIVKSLKAYVYLDQAPVQPVDLHEGLDNTIIMLRHKLKQGVNVRREYAGHLPRVMAYGSELNQVWTNIIDNSVDAMDGKGQITLRTQQQGDWIVVEIEDTGPGIPEEIQSKIFSPFFTTKPVGKGTGLGLNISYKIIQKHGGEIKVFSQPGKTRFQVCLPVNFETVQSGSTVLSSIPTPGNEELIAILDSVKNIAVVGMSAHEDQPNYTVPAYLKEQGYRIIPVNPNVEEVLDTKSYPDLISVPDPVDLVLVFRRSEAVPEVVDQAIEKGAKVVWMQEGIVNEAAAQKALDAGLEVVMNTCMRATHKRLKGSE
jgi:signal transduction histidine kinase/predicted CoA-binding protein